LWPIVLFFGAKTAIFDRRTTWQELKGIIFQGTSGTPQLNGLRPSKICPPCGILQKRSAQGNSTGQEFHGARISRGKNFTGQEFNGASHSPLSQERIPPEIWKGSAPMALLALIKVLYILSFF
jgi:hypothetical protein